MNVPDPDDLLDGLKTAAAVTLFFMLVVAAACAVALALTPPK
jgi:hypothetical protein